MKGREALKARVRIVFRSHPIRLVAIAVGTIIILACGSWLLIDRIQSGPWPPSRIHVLWMATAFMLLCAAAILPYLDIRVAYHTPVCRRCGYVVDAATQRLCPECGSDLAQPDAVGMERPWRLPERRKIALIIGIGAGVPFIVLVAMNLIN